MQRHARGCSADFGRLELSSGEEQSETRIRRLIKENPVIIFSRSSCCMCHVMKKLFLAVGVHPTVIQLDDRELKTLAGFHRDTPPAPVVFIGGNCVGGLESLVALHLSGRLVPELALSGYEYDPDPTSTSSSVLSL